MKSYDRKPNDYDVPPLANIEKTFLLDGINPDLIPIYEKIREIILLFGMIETRVTRNYINFKHPYRGWNHALHQKEIKMGTLANVYFKNDYITIAFNTRNKTPRDPKNILIPTKSYGVCEYYTIIKSMQDLEGLDYIIKQVIYLVSNEHRIVRINNRFITIDVD